MTASAITLNISRNGQHLILLRWLDAEGKEIAFNYFELPPNKEVTITNFQITPPIQG